MSLVRVHSPLSQLIIGQLGDAGGPRADQVSAELDSLIAWAKLSPRCIHVNTTSTGNVGGGTDSLHSFSLPAGSLATDNDFVDIQYGGTFPNVNNNTKQIIVSIDSQVVFNMAGAGRDIDGAFSWKIILQYIRVSATTVRATGAALLGRVFGGTDGALDAGNSRWYYEAINATPTVANLTNNAVTLLVQAVGTANGDITQNASTIHLTQF